MKSRLIVAAIGVPLLYLVVLSKWQHSLIFALLIAGAMGIAVLELYAMGRRWRPFVPAGLIPVVLSPLLAWKLGEPGIFLAILISIPLILAFHGLSTQREDPFASIAVTMMGVLYLAPSAGLAVLMRQAEAGFGLVLLLIAAVFLNDTGAYVVGRAIGRHKLSPRISPNKSIEGFVGGVTIGTFVLWFGHWLVRYGTADHAPLVLHGAEAAAIGLCVALATPTGDLFESLLKRAAGVKDSGNLLGEHGGMLDRIDALLLAIPVMYVGIYFAGAL